MHYSWHRPSTSILIRSPKLCLEMMKVILLVCIKDQGSDDAQHHNEKTNAHSSLLRKEEVIHSHNTPMLLSLSIL